MNLAGLHDWGGLAGASLDAAGAVIAGIPYDGSAVYRRGAAGAPARIRELSPVMPPVTEDGRALLGLPVHDLGDLDAGVEIETGWRTVADRLAEIPKRALLTVIGGDHCSVIPVLAAQARRHPDLRVAWIDAHPDLCDFSRGSAWSCGCALRRGLEVAGIDPGRVAFAGGRDYDAEEVKFIADHGELMIGSRELAADPSAAARRIAERLRGGPVHVSFDIDVLDPAFAPGTEVPSAGGISTRMALDFLRELAAGVPLVGFDVMEVAPALDHNDITTLAALKLIFEFWGLAWKPPT
jgi:agmatinase